MHAARLALKALRTRFWDQRPFILSHLITARCNADCVTCLWKMPASARTNELTTAEIAALYEDAAGAGFLELVLWGGEPMVRPDCGEALRAARGCGLGTTLITNGWWLDERAGEVLPWTQRLLVSVDGLGAAHDEIRRCPGLFARLDKGLLRAKERYPDVRIVIISVISKRNLGEIERIAAYGRERGAQVVFQPMNVTDYGFAGRAIDLARILPGAEEEARAASSIAELRQQGYPVRDSSIYLRHLGERAWHYRCHYKKVLLRVEPGGEVLDCTRTAAPLANVRQESLADFTASRAFRSFEKRAEECNRCRDAGVIELSHLWEGRPESFRNALAMLG